MPWNEVMGKFKRGELKSGSDKGPPVKSRDQAIAIMMSEKKKAGEGKKEYMAHDDGGDVKGPPLPPPRPLSLPSLHKGETGRQSPEAAPPDKYFPSKGNMWGGPAMMAKKGGPMKKYDDGGSVGGDVRSPGTVPTPAPTPVTTPRPIPAAVKPSMPRAPAQGGRFSNLNRPVQVIDQSAPTAPVSAPPMVNIPVQAGPSGGYKKGGEVCASNAKQFKQNLVETAVNRTGPTGLAKGGEIKEKGWVKPSWRRW